MTAKQIAQANVIAKIQYTKECRVFFHNFERVPQYGLFIETPDSQELRDKGFIRFVPDNKNEAWRRTGNFGSFSKIFKIDEIKDIVVFDTVTPKLQLP